jgi:adenosylhomocysteinase
MTYDIKDPSLSFEGKKRIEWAENDMPVLKIIKEGFEKEKPFFGLRIAACLHVTAETANLVRTLKAGGADVVLCASNPLSTQNDVAAALSLEYGIPTFAIKGENNETYYKHLNIVLDFKPNITMDDGADLISLLQKERKDQMKEIVGSMEETTTGVIRLRALEKTGELGIPIVAVNDAQTKNMLIIVTEQGNLRLMALFARPMFY